MVLYILGVYGVKNGLVLPWCTFGRLLDSFERQTPTPNDDARAMRPAATVMTAASSSTASSSSSSTAAVSRGGKSAAVQAYEARKRRQDAATIRPQRRTCDRCRRAIATCVCETVKKTLGARGKIQNKTRVWILQDRHEFFRALGSAAVCDLALENVDVEWYDVKYGPGPRRPEEEEMSRIGLLWPDDDAIDLAEVARDAESHSDAAEGEDARSPLDALIVLDSTWHRAKGMYYRIPWLAELKKYKISPTRGESNYRIRKQPAPGCLSTAECVAEALVALEGERSRAWLIADAFDAMIDNQLDAEAAAPRNPRRRKSAALVAHEAAAARARQ